VGVLTLEGDDVLGRPASSQVSPICVPQAWRTTNDELAETRRAHAEARLGNIMKASAISASMRSLRARQFQRGAA